MPEFYDNGICRYQRAAQPYLAAIARGVRDDKKSRAFLLQGTEFARTYAAAEPLWSEQWRKRDPTDSMACPFWSNYWYELCQSCNCRIDESVSMETWVHDGAKAETYPQVKPIFAANCISCHMAGAQSIPPLASFEAVQKVAKADTGTSITDLAKVSHIHLFGISIIFLLTGAIFALSTAPVWIRVSLVVIPYLTILMDIGSWWFTKYLDPAFFSYVVVAGGACMGFALAAQILIALWEMWIEPLEKSVSVYRTRADTLPTATMHRV